MSGGPSAVPAGWAKIGSLVTVTGQANVDFTLSGGYKKWAIAVTDYRTGGDGHVAIRASVDGGSSFLSDGTYDYAQQGFYATGARQDFNAKGNASGWLLKHDASGYPVSGTIFLSGNYTGLTNPSFNVWGVGLGFPSAANRPTTINFANSRDMAATVNAVRLFDSSASNIVGGTFQLFGVM